MLTKVILENYKIYKNKTVFDLKKSNIAMIFGPESEGKSTLLNSIKLFLELSVNGRNIKDGLNLSLLATSDEFSLEYYFLINKENIVYKVRFSPVFSNIYEKLSIGNNIIFERDNKTIKIIGEHYDFNLDSLFVHKILSQSNDDNETLKAWSNFLKSSVYINPLDKKIVSYSDDKTISNAYIENHGVNEFNDFFKDNNIDIFISYSRQGVNKKITINIDSTKNKTIFVTHHKNKTTLPFTEESLSVQTLLNLLPSFFHLKKNNGILLIDNLSNVLHPKTEEILIKHFIKHLKESSFVFVSSNAYFLLSKVINPDSVYIVYSKHEQGSSLKLLSAHKSKILMPQSPLNLKDLPEQKYKN